MAEPERQYLRAVITVTGDMREAKAYFERCRIDAEFFFPDGAWVSELVGPLSYIEMFGP